MNVWFMFDNHTFALVGNSMTPRVLMEAMARDLFAEEGSGYLFVKEPQKIDLIGTSRPDGTFGVTDESLTAFFDRVEELINWECR
jgi:hypothetical protein